MQRIKFCVSNTSERFVLLIEENATILQLAQNINQRLAQRHPQYQEWKDWHMNVKVRLDDGFEYELFPYDLVKHAIQSKDIIVVNFENVDKKDKHSPDNVQVGSKASMQHQSQQPQQPPPPQQPQQQFGMGINPQLQHQQHQPLQQQHPQQGYQMYSQIAPHMQQHPGRGQVPQQALSIRPFPGGQSYPPSGIVGIQQPLMPKIIPRPVVAGAPILVQTQLQQQQQHMQQVQQQHAQRHAQLAQQAQAQAQAQQGQQPHQIQPRLQMVPPQQLPQQQQQQQQHAQQQRVQQQPVRQEPVQESAAMVPVDQLLGQKGVGGAPPIAHQRKQRQQRQPPPLPQQQQRQQQQQQQQEQQQKPQAQIVDDSKQSQGKQQRQSHGRDQDRGQGQGQGRSENKPESGVGSAQAQREIFEATLAQLQFDIANVLRKFSGGIIEQDFVSCFEQVNGYSLKKEKFLFSSMRQLFEKYKDCIDIDRQSRQDGKWILYPKGGKPSKFKKSKSQQQPQQKQKQKQNRNQKQRQEEEKEKRKEKEQKEQRTKTSTPIDRRGDDSNNNNNNNNNNRKQVSPKPQVRMVKVSPNSQRDRDREQSPPKSKGKGKQKAKKKLTLDEIGKVIDREYDNLIWESKQNVSNFENDYIRWVEQSFGLTDDSQQQQRSNSRWQRSNNNNNNNGNRSLGPKFDLIRGYVSLDRLDSKVKQYFGEQKIAQQFSDIFDPKEFDCVNFQQLIMLYFDKKYRIRILPQYIIENNGISQNRSVDSNPQNTNSRAKNWPYIEKLDCQNYVITIDNYNKIESKCKRVLSGRKMFENKNIQEISKFIASCEDGIGDGGWYNNKSYFNTRTKEEFVYYMLKSSEELMNESANTIRYMKGENLVTQIELLAPNTTYSKLMEDVVNQYPRLFNGEELTGDKILGLKWSDYENLLNDMNRNYQQDAEAIDCITRDFFDSSRALMDTIHGVNDCDWSKSKSPRHCFLGPVYDQRGGGGSRRNSPPRGGNVKYEPLFTVSLMYDYALLCPFVSGRPLLQFLIKKVHYDDIKWLLEIHPRLSINKLMAHTSHKMFQMYNAMHIAAFDGRDDVIRLLVKYGGDPLVTNRPFNENVIEAARNSRKKGSKRIVQYLESIVNKQQKQQKQKQKQNEKMKEQEKQKEKQKEKAKVKDNDNDNGKDKDKNEKNQQKRRPEQEEKPLPPVKQQKSKEQKKNQQQEKEQKQKQKQEEEEQSQLEQQQQQQQQKPPTESPPKSQSQSQSESHSESHSDSQPSPLHGGATKSEMQSQSQQKQMNEEKEMIGGQENDNSNKNIGLFGNRGEHIIPPRQRKRMKTYQANDQPITPTSSATDSDDDEDEDENQDQDQDREDDDDEEPENQNSDNVGKIDDRERKDNNDRDRDRDRDDGSGSGSSSKNGNNGNANGNPDADGGPNGDAGDAQDKDEQGGDENQNDENDDNENENDDENQEQVQNEAHEAEQEDEMPPPAFAMADAIVEDEKQAKKEVNVNGNDNAKNEDDNNDNDDNRSDVVNEDLDSKLPELTAVVDDHDEENDVSIVKMDNLCKAIEHGYDKILNDRSMQGREHTLEGYVELFQLEHAAIELYKDPSGKNVDFKHDMRKYSGAINFHQFVTFNCNNIFDIIVCAAYLLENENGAKAREDFIPECKYYVVRLETRSKHFEMSNRSSPGSNGKEVFCRRIANANTKFSMCNVVRYCNFRNIVRQIQLLCGTNSNAHTLILSLVKNLHAQRNQQFCFICELLLKLLWDDYEELLNVSRDDPVDIGSIDVITRYFFNPFMHGMESIKQVEKKISEKKHAGPPFDEEENGVLRNLSYKICLTIDYGMLPFSRPLLSKLIEYSSEEDCIWLIDNHPKLVVDGRFGKHKQCLINNCCAFNKIETLKQLLTKYSGAINVTKKNLKNETCLDIARQYNHTEIIDILLPYFESSSNPAPVQPPRRHHQHHEPHQPQQHQQGKVESEAKEKENKEMENENAIVGAGNENKDNKGGSDNNDDNDNSGVAGNGNGDGGGNEDDIVNVD